MVSQRRVAAVALVVLVLLAGCGGGGDSVGLSGDPAENHAAEGTPGDGGGNADGGDDGAARSDDRASSSVAAQRVLIMTGNVTLVVEDFDAARADLASLARAEGGFVAGSTQRQHGEENRTWTSGRVVLRVPSESFQATFEATKERGEVASSGSSTRDVTDRLVDLEARLSNLRSQRDRLRSLYEEAEDTDAVLKVGKRLSNVQGRIERLEAEKRALEDRVAYSTITVRLRERPPDAPTPTTEPAYHETSLYRAFAASVGGVEVALRTSAVTVAYMLPYLLAFGLPVGVVAGVAYRRDLFP